ncbi:MAG TPA: hypothetical protein VFK36_11615, partial [Gemmatimonadales bacterium]|nr:hypothetical protein [Gemmatimonadales bacterium]
MSFPRVSTIAALLSFAALAVPAQLAAQSKPPSRYDARQVFDPLFMAEPGTAYRSADGSPGPDYWQNRADYKIEARLDER